jgi:hypothetical protein
MARAHLRNSATSDEASCDLYTKYEEPASKTDPATVLFEIGLGVAFMLLIAFVAELSIRFF